MAVINSVGNALTGSTGTGAFVGSNTPTLTTPVIGAATGTSINLGASTTISSFIDDDSFATASATSGATSESIKAYVLAQTGTILQIVNTQTGTVATGTTAIPVDNTIPQNTEGDQYMSVSITPVSATNKLVIQVVTISANAVANAAMVAALFQDSTANALAATIVSTPGGALTLNVFNHTMTAGTTSSTTFKVRIGGQSGTTTFNGANGVGYLGGVFSSSITVTEYAV